MSNKIDFKTLIFNIIKIFKERHIGYGETRLIKIAYLVEVNYFKKYKQRLTDTEWIFYKFGPFTFDFYNVLKDENIIKTNDEEGFIKIDFLEDEDIRLKRLPNLANVMLRKLVMEFGEVSLNELLDYVYFETEPMQQAIPKEPLDFSLIELEKPKHILKFKISEENKGILKEIKKRVRSKLESLPTKKLNEEISKNIFEDDEPFIEKQLKGKVNYEHN